MCILMCMCVCMTSTVPGWPKCQGWVVDAVLAQGQAHPHQLTPSSLASLAPCWELQPVSSAASISCLQEGQAVTPFFHFLWRPWCFREADYSRLVAMADCFCCCPSPCWPHQSVWKSTGPLKPLIEFMVSPDELRGVSTHQTQIVTPTSNWPQRRQLCSGAVNKFTFSQKSGQNQLWMKKYVFCFFPLR